MESLAKFKTILLSKKVKTMKFKKNTSKNPMLALKKSSIAALIPLLLTSSMTMFVSTNVIAGPAEGREFCGFTGGAWKRIRSKIYRCAYKYKDYDVYNFKNNTVRYCSPGAEKCTTERIAFHNKEEGNPKSEK